MNLVSTNFNYSTKNIPIHNNKTYFKAIISKTETFIRNIRWRAFFFLNPDQKCKDKETFGFRSTKPAPMVPELKEFEDGLLNIIQTIKFNNVSDEFQNKLKEDIKGINNEKNVYIKADKTTNFYKISPEDYTKLLEKNIQKEYKKENDSTNSQTIIEDKKISDSLGLSDRIDTPNQNSAFITIKDHKPNFRNNPQCRLINPSKSEIGIISKKIVEKINTKVRKDTKLNQWKNTDEVIEWYKAIPNKQQKTAIIFDICNFYPSITEELLDRAIEFAKKHTHISDNDTHIIKQAKRTSLFYKNDRWSKKSGTFDVTMGSYDGAETCELVGLYILSQLEHLDINVGLYRDDGLAISNKTPKQTEKIKKEICRIFKENGLAITIEANKKVVDFLDITLELNTGTFRPFSKPNNTPLYVHNKSNHPPSILKNIPASINKRLSNNSSNANIFNDATHQYKEALQRSGYKPSLKYEEHDRTKETHKRQRTRHVTWFNPPFSKNVKTPVASKFFNLLEKCFPANSKLRQIMNKNTIKISYSTLPNMEKIIAGHNKKIMANHQKAKKQERTCNCRAANPCPLESNCLKQNVIYQATVTESESKRVEKYIGLTECSFKTRYNLHKSSFKNKNKSKATALSEHIWSLKEKNMQHIIDWRIVSRANPYSTATKTCNLCLEEKYYIIIKPETATLNRRNELSSSCPHRRKHLLANFKPT